MFRRKQDIDKHVKDLLQRVKNEHERNLRCYHIASLYYKAQDFESAKEYVLMYLTVRDDSSLAHKLLGQCYEGLNLKSKALAAYRRSLELDANQDLLILKICEILCDKDVEFDPAMARYWVDRAASLYPYDPSVFIVKEMLLTTDDNIVSGDLENLLQSELKARPTDDSVRIKVLNLYVDSGRVELALSHANEVEAKQTHSTSLAWYQCFSRICEVYNKELSSKCNWEFYIQWMSALDRVCSLSLNDVLQESDFIKATGSVYSLDQVIFKAVNNSVIPCTSEMFKEFIKHIGAQLMFHITVLLLKRAKKSNGLWRETKKMVLPLSLMATFDSPNMTVLANSNIKETHQKIVKTWVNIGRCRIIQAGEILMSLVSETQSEQALLQKLFHFTANNWKEQIYQKVFSSLDEINHSTSYFLTNKISIPQKIPSQNSFKPSTFVPNFEDVYIGSLHHLIWLGLQTLQNPTSILKCKISPSFHTTYFRNLQFTVNSLNNVGVETLNQLDIDSFLYAAVFCAGLKLDEQKANGYLSQEKPLIVLPADISIPFSTGEQNKWWQGACNIIKSGNDAAMQTKTSMSDLRHLLQNGIEIVRGENIQLPLLVNLARTFSLRAADSEKLVEAEGCDARAIHLWQLAIPLLKRLSTGHSLNKYQKNNSLFEYKIKDLEGFEINALLDEAKYFFGCWLMKNEKYEEAITQLKNVNTVAAVYKQAVIYQKLAEQQINGYCAEEVTSEMRCNQAIMATKARDSLFRARDMIKDSPNHPFYHKIKDKLTYVDELLSRIEPDNSNCNLFTLEMGEKDNYNTDGNLSCESVGSGGMTGTNSRMNHSLRFHQTSSTPKRHYNELKHRNKSAEIIEIITMQQNTSQLKMQQVLEHEKLNLEKIDSIIFEQKMLKKLIEDLTNKFVSFETDIKSVLSDIKKEIKRPPDLYNIIEDEEYGEEMLPYQNYTQYYPPQRSGQNTGAVAYGGTTIPQYFSPRVDQMYQGAFYNQGALPFSDGQQLPDFLRTMPPKHPTAPLQTSLGLSAAAVAASAAAVGGTTPASIGNLNNANRLSTPNFHGPSFLSGETNRTPPTNVVITTSDTLPTSVPPVQPILSVTIPPQHRLGDVNMSIGASTSTTGAVHQFQIQLPLQQQKQQILKSSTIDSDDEAASSESTVLGGGEGSINFNTIPSSKVDDLVEVLFSKKAELFKFEGTISKGIAIGDSMILKSTRTNETRIMMKNDKDQKVHLNCTVTYGTKITYLGPETGWCLTVANSGNENKKVEKFCFKFNLSDDGKKFKEIIDKAELELPRFAISNPSSIGQTSASFKFVTTTSQPTSITTSPATTDSSSSVNKIIAGGFTFLSPPKFQLTDETKVVKPAEMKKTESPFANWRFTMDKGVPKKKTDGLFSNWNSSIFSNCSSSSSDENVTEASGAVMGGIKEPQFKLGSDKTMGPFFSNTNNIGTTFGGTSTAPLQNMTFFSPPSVNKSISKTNTFSFDISNNQEMRKSLDDPQQSFFSANNLFSTDISVKSTLLNKSPLTKEPNTTTPQLHSTDDDFVPTATFDPVIPLPELVQVKSGEEGEIILFEERAKLYRHCMDKKEWKERGIGKMKILKNEETGVIRLVMRREQVLKVCCNHRLTKDIKLRQTSDRFYTWGAKDFSEDDNEGVNELFGLRFKTTEQALAFKEVFENEQTKLQDNTPEKPKEISTQDLPPLKANYAEGTWECMLCYVRNNPEVSKCIVCGTNKPRPISFEENEPITPEKPKEMRKQDLPPLKANYAEGTWECILCYVRNNPETTKCVSCSTNKPGTISVGETDKITQEFPSLFSFGIPQTSQEKPITLTSQELDAAKEEQSSIFSSPNSSGTFFSSLQSVVHKQQPKSYFTYIPPTDLSFDNQPLMNNKELSGESNKGLKSVFNFGNTLQGGQTGKSTFTFALNTSNMQSSVTQKHDSASDHGESDNEATANDDIYFPPVIPLPDKIILETGEEDETVLYCQRAKLFRYDGKEKEWKERGLGDIKVLKHNATGKIRLLMRREIVFKISLNHYLTPEIIMKEKDDKSWIWMAKDFASGELIKEQFAIRFKTPEIAKEFKRVIDEAQQGQIETPSEQKESEDSDNSNDIEIVYEQKVSEELRKKAESLKLPSNYYLYLNAKPCPGCLGCDNEDDNDCQNKVIKDKAVTKPTEQSNKTTKPSLMQKSVLSEAVSQTSIIKPSTLQPTKSDTQVKQKTDNLIQAGSIIGKDQVETKSRGFFTQSSFATPVAGSKNIFGGSLNDSKTSQQISGNNDGIGSEVQQPTSIFGGRTAGGDSAAPAPGQMPSFSSISFSGSAANQKFTFGGSQLEQKSAFQQQQQSSDVTPAAENVQPSIFGGPPSSGLLPKPAQNLFFGGSGGGSGDIPSFSQLASTVGTSSNETIQKRTEGDKGSGDQINFENQVKPNHSALKPNQFSAQKGESKEQIQFDLEKSLVVNRHLPSFANIAASATNIFNTGGTNVKWEGAGSTVFGSGNISKPVNLNTSTGSNKSNSGENEEAEYDPHYDPIVALPELIELKTGEEDEKVLFNEKAKLYRYDGKTKEWKERGVGQMKLLKHKEETIYRLLMRRDTVHKVVCNQRITSDLDLKPMSSNPSVALCWSAMNMAEEYERPKLENLSIRFKNMDQASAFKKNIDDAIKHINN